VIQVVVHCRFAGIATGMLARPWFAADNALLVNVTLVLYACLGHQFIQTIYAVSQTSKMHESGDHGCAAVVIPERHVEDRRQEPRSFP